MKVYKLLILILIMREVKCTKCQYKWTTKSKLVKVSCPSCGHKIVLIELKGGEKYDNKNRV